MASGVRLDASMSGSGAKRIVNERPLWAYSVEKLGHCGGAGLLIHSC
jgi:hypothetical protein